MILVCAATETEAREVRRGLAGAAGFEVLTTGVGPERAAAALQRWLAGGGAHRPSPRPSLRQAGGGTEGEGKGAPPTLVVSTGFAGALTPGIAPRSWVTARALYRLAGDRVEPLALAPGLLRLAEGAIACDVVSTDHVVRSPPPGVGAPAAGDMESAALAEVAAAVGVPSLVLRLVTDAPGHRLPPLAERLAEALAARDPAVRATHALGAAVAAARSPVASAVFLRETARWREGLREGWAARWRAGLACDAVRGGP